MDNMMPDQGAVLLEVAKKGFPMGKPLNSSEWPADVAMDTFRAQFADIRDGMFWDLYARWRANTLISPERLFTSYVATLNVLENKVAGAIVECGVFRGGAFCLLMATALARASASELPHFWAYDTFEGFPEGTFDQLASGAPFQRDSWHTEDFEAIFRDNIERVGYPADKIHIVRGSVLNTIPEQAPERIAFLHLDTDYYSATLHELRHLYPRVDRDGAVMVDDYGAFEGARRAVTEYCATLERQPLMLRTDYTGRLLAPR